MNSRQVRLLLSTLVISILLPLTTNISGAHAVPPPPPPPGMGWTAQEASGWQQWWRVSSSADGKTIIAGRLDGQVQISHDYGVTWDAELAHTFGGTDKNVAVTVSDDGMKMAVAPQDGDIWTSTDSGVTWRDSYYADPQSWATIASSSDGSTIIAGGSGGSLIKSSDSGATWTVLDSGGYGAWLGIGISDDGKTIIAADLWDRRTLMSFDSGTTWQTLFEYVPVLGVAVSNDGTHLAVAIQGGDIFTSSDSGQTWVDRQNSGAHNWISLSSSSDGSTLIAGTETGIVSISRDYGNTWSEQTWVGSGTWIALASSGDGHRLVVGSADGGYIDTYFLPYTPSTLRSLTPARIAMDQNEITCSAGTLSYSTEGHLAEPAVLTSESFRLVSSTGVVATSTSIGASAHFLRSSLPSGQRYTCQIVAIERDAMVTLTTEDVILKEKVWQQERADLAVVVSNYYLARTAALTAKNTAVAELMASDDHSNRDERLTQILQSYHLAIDQALLSKEQSTATAHAKAAATLATAGVSVVN